MPFTFNGQYGGSTVDTCRSQMGTGSSRHTDTPANEVGSVGCAAHDQQHTSRPATALAQES